MNASLLKVFIILFVIASHTTGMRYTVTIDALTHGARPHEAQSRALEALAHGTNTLAIMGTGRGKSLIFQVHAAREAILHGRASVFVYPLRALISDQAFHLAQLLGAWGVTVGVLTGDTDAAERERTFGALAVGSLDIVLTTPEFLSIHRDRFAADAVGVAWGL